MSRNWKSRSKRKHKGVSILAIIHSSRKIWQQESPLLTSQRLKEGLHDHLKMILAQPMSLCQDHTGWLDTYFSYFKWTYCRCTRNPAEVWPKRSPYHKHGSHGRKEQEQSLGIKALLRATSGWCNSAIVFQLKEEDLEISSFVKDEAVKNPSCFKVLTSSEGCTRSTLGKVSYGSTRTAWKKKRSKTGGWKKWQF